jgi:hypothetical protein
LRHHSAKISNRFVSKKARWQQRSEVRRNCCITNPVWKEIKNKIVEKKLVNWNFSGVLQ